MAGTTNLVSRRELPETMSPYGWDAYAFSAEGKPTLYATLAEGADSQNITEKTRFHVISEPSTWYEKLANQIFGCLRLIANIFSHCSFRQNEPSSSIENDDQETTSSFTIISEEPAPSVSENTPHPEEIQKPTEAQQRADDVFASLVSQTKASIAQDLLREETALKNRLERTQEILKKFETEKT